MIHIQVDNLTNGGYYYLKDHDAYVDSYPAQESNDKCHSRRYNLEISFETQALRDLCEDESLAAQEIGTAAAEALKSRLSDIRAADSIYDVLAGRPQLGKYHGNDCYRFELTEGYHLTVTPSHTRPRKDAAGMTDWGRVRRVRVMLLERQK